MPQDFSSFDDRLRRLEGPEQKRVARMHRRLYFDGVKRSILRKIGFVMLLYCGITVAKITLVERVGQEGYAQRVAALEEGNLTERIAAKLLVQDGVMVFLKGSS